MLPILQAILLADNVYTDRETGKKVIAGTWNRITPIPPKTSEVTAEDGSKKRVLQFGPTAGSPHLYLSLTNIHGTIPLVVRFVSLGNYESICQWEFQVACDDPLSTSELVLRMPMLPITKAGWYALELLCKDDTPLGSLRVHAEEPKEEGEQTS